MNEIEHKVEGNSKEKNIRFVEERFRESASNQNSIFPCPT